MKLTAICLSSFLLLVAVPGRAQSQDPGASPANSTKPDSPAAGQTTAAEKKKPKKVWTNDEIGSAKGSVSVVGDSSSSSEKDEDKKPAGATGGDEVRKKQIENYRNQIQQFQAQIDAADKRIAQLKNFKGENTSPSGGINPNQGYNMVPVEDQVKQLEDKKRELQGKIEDVENDARKNGIESGDLR